ncbi:stage II sporulation protein D [Clostridium thermarum]|uniref:stage II sporulation protein D n=1 Tax=Clostridium thermarum TaxID=1716543 RepID=UPI0013D60F72|nr:stage II sporulation protein D [Clostridium thermarum]
MRRIIWTVNVNKSKYIIMVIAALILILPIMAPIFYKSNTKYKTYKKNEEYILDPSNVKASDLGIKYDKIKVYLTGANKIVEFDVEEYLPGVLAGEMPANFEMEALKAQAVAARTYAISRLKSLGGTGCSNYQGADLCDTIHCQVYMDKDTRMSGWEEDKREELWSKIVSAVKSTERQVLTYNGQLVMRPQYFAASSGRTEDAQTVFGFSEPYLKSVESPGEEIAKESFKKSYEFKYENLANTINKNFPSAKVSAKNLHKQIEILEISDAGTVTKMKIGNETITGSQFRFMLDLNSANFTLNFKQNVVEILCRGNGHGVGMSQWGANAMAKKGYDYISILTHYYQGTRVEKVQ